MVRRKRLDSYMSANEPVRRTGVRREKRVVPQDEQE
jgi:hypothetical protein